MTLACFWLAVAALSGASLTYRYIQDCPLEVRLLGGACSGLVLAGLLRYGIAVLAGMTANGDWLCLGVMLLPLVTLLRQRFRSRVMRDVRAALDRHHLRRLVPFLVCGLLLTPVLVGAFWHAIFVQPEGDQLAIYTDDTQNFGDLPMHLGLATSFAQGQNVPPQDIEFAGISMPYPFLVDFETAELYRLGAPVVEGMALHDLVMAAVFFAMVCCWTWAFTGDRRAAVVSPWLVLCSGGLGGWKFLQATGGSPKAALALLSHLNDNYTIQESGLRWGNTITCLLITQRSLLLGLPLMLWIVYLLWRCTLLPPGPHRNRLATAAGLLTASLVLVHSYLAVVVAGMGLLLAWTFRDTPSWTRFAVTSLFLSLPQGLWLTLGSGMAAGHFLSWSPGWDHRSENPIVFWLFNTGLFLPLLVLGLYRHRSEQQLRFYAPFVLCFIVPNLFRLAPWIWDNIKILYPWFLMSVPWVAAVLAATSRRGPLGWGLAILLGIGLTGSGALDVWRVVSHAADVRVFSGDAAKIGIAVGRALPPHTVVLRAPTCDSPIYLSGAVSVLGYTGHLVSRGIDLGTREEDQARIYRGDPDAVDLLKRYRVSFILVGPQEREKYAVNEAFFAQFRKVADWRGYRLYQTTQLKGP